MRIPVPLALFCWATMATAQVNPNAPKPAPKPKPAVVPATSGPKQFTGNSSILVVVDADGVLYVDYEKVGNVRAGETWKSPIMAGSHVVELRMGEDRWEKTEECKSGQQLIVRTELSKVRERRTEQVAQRREEAEAESQAKAQERSRAEYQAAEEARVTAELEKRRAQLPFLLASQMVKVDGGKYKMGCTKDQRFDFMYCRKDESPVHEVVISTFYITSTEVTQELWEAVMGTNPSLRKDCLTCPVENVSWFEVQYFIKTLNRLSGKLYRLPSEAEWEYAARGGLKSISIIYGDSGILGERAWISSNSDDAVHPVKQLISNELGLHDMLGNVSEWCEDWYADRYERTIKDPGGPGSGEYRVARGGSYSGSVADCRPVSRSGFKPTFKSPEIGFRLVHN